ncbi:hypothetical protein REH65_14755 [Saccharopolyspora sp. ID03-671]|uniref:hypothetical protein n=1 Tax=Saccharopolyspora sp. ID03-671 TaxID=3073066 RepID=UPI00324B515C
MLNPVRLRRIHLVCCEIFVLAAMSACTINIVPPGTPPAPPPATTAPSPPAPEVPPVVIQPREPVQNTHDCRQLQNAGMSFTQVVQYWYGLGSPTDMDDDSDGIPCETVYGEKNAPATTPSATTHDCATLQAQGMTFTEVTAYWNSLGSPTDMDDDADGIPCETVYGER